VGHHRLIGSRAGRWLASKAEISATQRRGELIRPRLNDPETPQKSGFMSPARHPIG
jgi:hypothetical protein